MSFGDGVTKCVGVENPDRVVLPLRCDVAGLESDALGFADDEWLPHFNTGYYEGDWSGIALRASGNSVSLYPDPHSASGFSNTSALDRCPNVRRLLEEIECEKTSIRFLRLGPGAHVREHRDYGLEFALGEARLHIPITTGPGVQFILDGIPIAMTPGECWYVDVNRPHSVANSGDTNRIHLVIDCNVNSWLISALRFNHANA